ncbi:PQQ-dependent sugar dehydrogenase [Spirosoma arcticum]
MNHPTLYQLVGRILNVCCLIAFLAVGPDFMAYGQLPAGFTQKKLTGDDINEATATVHTADGRVFIAERGGILKVFQNGTVATVHSVATTKDSEQGLLGITLHPQFATNGKCYLFYTDQAKTLHYIDVIVINTTNQVTSSSRVMAFDPILNGFHNGGAILFKDGLLYVAIGESNIAEEAIKLDTYRGKILRLTEDGQPAPGNPYYNEAGASRQKRSIWAIGMRNPWKMSLDPASGKVFVVNVGGGYEEINDVTAPDASKNYNYGWDGRGQSGPGQAPNTILPVFAYGHNGWGCAITSGVFFNPATTTYPAQYRNRFYFTDWCSAWLRSVDATNPGAGHAELSNTGFGRILGTSVGIDGNLYYVKYDTRGSLWRLEYGTGQALAIVNQPVSRTVVTGDAFTVAVTASGAAPLAYQWQKNGGAIAGATASAYTIARTAASDAANYRCVVTNSAGSVTSSEATLTVTAPNARPVARIIQPASSLTWSVGDVVRFSGEATDAEDGILPVSTYRWEARFYHKDGPNDEHWHPGPGLPGGVASGTFVADNGGETSPNIWFRLLLTVTDAQGRTGVDSVDIYPNKVVLTATANIPGLQLVLGTQRTAPFSGTFVVNTAVNLQAPSPQVTGGNSYTFTGWSQGGAANQTLRAPATNTTYTATYGTSTPPPGGTQSPYLGAAVLLPGKIEAENFDLGGEGVAYHDETTANSGNKHRPGDGVDIEGCAEGGFNIGYVATGEWLEYTVNVTTAGPYTLSARVATPYNANNFHVELDGQAVSGSIGVPNTGGFQAWQTVSVTTPVLTTGVKVLRVVMDSPNFNLNHLTFALAGATNSVAVTIASPTANATFAANSTVAINANVTSTGAAISNVEFFQGTTKLGEDPTAPYTFSWANVAAGSYSLTAKVTNAESQSAVSTPVPITVNPATGGNPNLALNRPATASSVERASFDPKLAVDGNMNTRWSSQFADPQWIYVDLGAVYTISQVKIVWEDARGKEYEVQVATTVGEWNRAVFVPNNADLVNNHTGLAVTGRHVRIYGTKRYTPYGYSILELEVYGTAGARQAAVSAANRPSDEKQYQLYPNPAHDVLTLDGITDDGIVNVINVGTARTTKIQSVNHTLDVSHLTTGTYVLEFIDDKRPVRLKFIKR